MVAVSTKAAVSMDKVSVSSGNRVNKVVVGLGVLLVVLLLFIAGLLTAVRPSVDIPFEIAKGLITLTIAVSVTGLLSFLIGERNRELAAHEERVRVLTAARQHLKSAVELVRVVQFFLDAHPFPKTFHEQIGRLIEARGRLQFVQRERYIHGQDVDDWIQCMIDYLEGISNEYAQNFSYITRERLDEEAEQKQILEGHDISPKPRSLRGNQDFTNLEAFLSLGDPPGERESSPFWQRYRDIQDWFEKQLPEPRAIQPKQARSIWSRLDRRRASGS
jgi:hypothetical protein